MANSTSANSKKAKKKTKKTTKKVSKTVKKAASRNKTAAKTKPKSAPTTATRQKMIEEAAYFYAQQRNFATGHEMNDWLRAETEVDKIINKQ